MSSTNECACGYPHRRPNDNYCLKCNQRIGGDRIQVAEIIEFPANFANDPCKCSETARANWGSRTILEVTVCNFCNLYQAGEAPGDFVYFKEEDLPQVLDPNKPQYKVITQKDRFFSSKFDPAVIEKALNEYAQEGWVLKQAVTADFGSAGMSRNELILFMEKMPDGQINN